MPDFRRGIAAIKEAQESSRGGGDFKPWVPKIEWKDGDEKYVLFLTGIEETPLVELHEWIPVGEGEKGDGTKFQRFEWFISRTDPAIGEDSDPLTEKGSDPKQRNVGIAVELEPIMTTVKGRPRPKGFEVKTHEFERSVRDDDGEATDEKETVVAPVIGVVTQSPHNFFGYLGSFNETEAPVEETAFKVIRRGGDKNTAYDFTPYLDQDIDLTNLIEFVDGITYLNESMDEISEAVAELETDEAAHLIALALLDARLDELADGERYDELTGDIEKIEPKYGKKKKESATSEKPKRTSQKSRARKKEEPEAEEAEAEEAPKKKRGQADKATMTKFDELRKKAKDRATAAA